MSIEPRLEAIRHAARRANGTFSKNWSPLTDEERAERRREGHRKWNAKNKEHIATYNKARSEKKRLSKPPKPILTEEDRKRKKIEFMNGWRARNKIRMREQHRAWRKKRRGYIKQKQRAYRSMSEVKLKKRQKAQTEEAKQKRREYLNRQAVRERNRALANARVKRYLLDPEARLTHCLRVAINRALRLSAIKQSWREFITYDIAALRCHLERQFQKGMTWENRGKSWHIDHIVPISALRGDIRACWALSNLRPLWASENLAKTNKRIFLV